MRAIRFLFFCSLLWSCSVTKRLDQSAKQTVLNEPALQTAHVGISIYEPATGKYWYNYQGDKYFVPASNTKLATCYAAMKYLGDSLVGLRYQLANDSVILIKSTGDPSFLHQDFKSQPVYNLLRQYKYVAFTNSLFSEDFLGNGWSWNDFKEGYMAQRSDFPLYGNVVQFKKKGNDTIESLPVSFLHSSIVTETLKTGFEITKPWEENKFLFQNGPVQSKQVPFRPDPFTIELLLRDTLQRAVGRSFDKEGFALSTQLSFVQPDGQIKYVPVVPTIQFQQFKTLYSQPTDSLLRPMMHRSDNFFAEQALLMVSNEHLGFMNDEKIIDTLLKTDFKGLPQKPRWVDGSGLSRYNLFSPQDFVFILAKMEKEFGMPRLKNILATGGEGTLSNYYVNDSGYIYAKTGTLSGVVALSGFLYTIKGKQLIFSVLVNNHQGSATAVRRAVETFIKKVREKN